MLSSLLFIVYTRVLCTKPRDKSDLRSQFTQSQNNILPIMKIVYICEKCVNLVERSISRKKHLTQDVWHSKSCAIADVVLSKKFEEPWSILIIDRQSQTCQRGCCFWDLQDELFAFCGRIGAARMNFSTGSSARI